MQANGMGGEGGMGHMVATGGRAGHLEGGSSSI